MPIADLAISLSYILPNAKEKKKCLINCSLVTKDMLDRQHFYLVLNLRYTFQMPRAKAEEFSGRNNAINCFIINHSAGTKELRKTG